jgi:hypothetical protein
MDAQLRLIPRSQASTREATPPPSPTRRRLRSAPPATTDHASPTTRGDEVEPNEAPVHWRIDDSARERGRAGISRAREALGQARRPLTSHHHTTAA